MRSYCSCGHAIAEHANGGQCRASDEDGRCLCTSLDVDDDFDAVISMDAAIAIVVDLEQQRMEVERLRNIRKLRRACGWTPAQVDAMPDYLVDYLVQHLAGAE